MSRLAKLYGVKERFAPKSYVSVKLIVQFKFADRISFALSQLLCVQNMTLTFAN